jgi:glycosyltransferase involved in cell wall biosynthesis
MAWVEQVTLHSKPLVSVIVPTRDRVELLPRALESVVDQSYANWELIVSDDSTGDETAALIGTPDDPRVRYLRGGPSSGSAARNRGTAAARGELIAYLDDDNRMHPNWLKSVVWAFEQRPEAEILYGALALDDTSRLPDDAAPEMPRIWFERYDREALLTSNVADASAIAHRASLTDARYDESVRVLADWEFFLRMTADREPLMLPVVACFYHLDAKGRLSDDRERRRAEAQEIGRRARALRERE